MYNTEKAREFIEDEYKNWQLEKLELEKSIQLNDSKLESINSEISKIEDNMDKSDYSFHSVSYQDEGAIRLDELRNSKEDILSSNKQINVRLDVLNQKIDLLSSIINDDGINLKSTKVNYEILKNIEFERERISRDIHDTVVQTLTALVHKDEFIYQLVDKDPNRAKLELSSNKTALKDCINELREIISDLRPMAIDDLGFEGAFNVICSRFDDTSDVIFKYSFEGNEDSIETIIGISALRIITELTSNSLKYSNCKKIIINVKALDNILKIYHCDDGIGFDYENQNYVKYDNTGFGMVMLRERVELLNGVISYSNQHGSEFTITIPLN